MTSFIIMILMMIIIIMMAVIIFIFHHPESPVRVLRLTRPPIAQASTFASSVRQLSKLMDALGYAALKNQLMSEAEGEHAAAQRTVTLSKEAKKALKNADHLLK